MFLYPVPIQRNLLQYPLRPPLHQHARELPTALLGVGIVLDELFSVGGDAVGAVERDDHGAEVEGCGAFVGFLTGGLIWVGLDLGLGGRQVFPCGFDADGDTAAALDGSEEAALG